MYKFSGFRIFNLCLFLFQSATEFIRCKPDIACFAKLMTGGIVPLAVTLASEAVFGAFIGDSKVYSSVFTICLSSICFCERKTCFSQNFVGSAKMPFLLLICGYAQFKYTDITSYDWWCNLIPLLQLQALLHGHSYTAHAVGCTAAVKSIKWFKDSKSNHNLISEAMLLREVCEKAVGWWMLF